MSKDNVTAAMLMAIIAVRQNVYNQTQVPNANTNGGRRVPRRNFRQRLTDRRVISAANELLFSV